MTEHAQSESYGGATRFELELEFVQLLSNPWYLNHLAVQKMFEKPEFIAYLDYLQYWSKPEFARFLSYPGPTLRALELLQQKKFRDQILRMDIMMKMVDQGVAARPK